MISKKVGAILKIEYRKQDNELYKQWYDINLFIHLKVPVVSHTRMIYITLDK